MNSFPGAVLARRAAVLLAAAGLLSACTAWPGPDGRAGTSLGRPGVRSAPQPVSDFPPLPGLTSDGRDSYLSTVARSGQRLVAAGTSDVAGVYRPLFAYSDDDGRSWRRGLVRSVTLSGDDAVNQVLATRGQFFALGDTAAGRTVWSSRDGRSWVRHQVSSDVMGDDTSVTALGATTEGLVAVGNTAAAGHRAAPAVWTSDDGRTWRRLGGPGLGPIAGTDIRLTGVSAAGHVVVAVGDATDHHGEQDHPVVWRSSDDGRHWRQVRLLAGFGGGGTRSWFEAVTWSDDRFVAVGAGGDTDRYAGLIAWSFDGVHWQAQSDGPGLVTSEQTYLTAVTAAGDQVWAFGANCARGCSAYGVMGHAGSWRSAALPVGGDGDDGVAQAVTRSASGAVIAVGSGDPLGEADQRIWRAADGRSFRRVPPPAAATPARQVTYVAQMAGGGGQFVAVGSAGGEAVAWTSRDGVRYGAPVALSRDRHVSVTGVVHGVHGWLATGSESVGDNEQALVWTSTDGRHWLRRPSGLFGRADTYAYNDIYAATASGSGWVAVGTRSTDGEDSAGALAYTSPDGGAWRPARDHVTLRFTSPTRGEAIHSLDGSTHGTREMLGVADIDHRLVAVGDAQPAEDAPSSDAAVWTSANGREWVLSMLPTCAGGSSSADNIGSAGRLLVAFGSATRGQTTTGCVWTSTDRGHTWRVRRLPGAAGRHVSVDSDAVVHDGNRIVLAGAVGRPGSSRPVLWTSTDAMHWRLVRPADRRLAASGYWQFQGLVGHGATLVAVLTRRSVDGVTSVAVSLAI